MEEREPGLRPLADDAVACALVFTILGEMYQPMAVLGILAGLHAKQFSGVCECYIHPDVLEGENWMGVGLAFVEPPHVTWWDEFADCVAHAIAEDEHANLAEDGWQRAVVGDLRDTMLHAGTAGFVDGAAVWVSDPDNPDPDSPFTALCRSINK